MAMPSANPGYSDDGVDLSLIRWSLEMTPVERLRYAARYAAGVERIRATHLIETGKTDPAEGTIGQRKRSRHAAGPKANARRKA